LYDIQSSDRLNLKSNSDRPSPPTKPDRLNLKSNSDRPSTPTNRSPKLHIKQRSPLITHKTRSPKSQYQTAIAPHPHKFDRLFPLTTTNPIAYSLKSNSDRPSSSIDRSPIPSNQTVIAKMIYSHDLISRLILL
jgi:hypothetical protein